MNCEGGTSRLVISVLGRLVQSKLCVSGCTRNVITYLDMIIDGKFGGDEAFLDVDSGIR